MTDAVEGSSSRASLRTVGRNTGILFGSQTITWLLSAAVLPILSRVIGPTRMGQFAVALSLWAIVGVIGGLGMSTLVTLESARNNEQAGRLIGPVVRARVLSSIAAWIFVIGFAWTVGFSRDIVLLAVLSGIAINVEVVGEPALAALVGLERMGVVARVTITSRVVGAVTVLIALAVTRSVFVVAAVAVVPAFVSSLMLFTALFRATTVPFSATWSEVRSVVRRGSPYLLGGVALIAYQQVDVIVMSLLVDEKQIGWYGAADRLFGTTLFAPVLLTTALLPALTREHSRDPAAALAMLERTFDLLVVIAVPSGLIVLVSADQVSSLLFGAAFAEAGPVLAVFGLVLMMTFFSILFGNYAFATGRQTVWIVLMFAAIAATIVLDLALVPWTDSEFDNGAIGGSLSYFITESAMVLFGFWKIAPQIVTRCRIARIAKVAAAGVCFLLASWFIRDMFFLLPSLAGLVAYVVAVVGLRALDREDFAALMRLVPARRAKHADN